jgi:hypothetical protein
MVIYGHGDHYWLARIVTVTKKYTHLSIEPVFLEIFDEVAKRLETRTLPRHTRSGFINKGARLWVDAMKEDCPELKPVIEEIERRHEGARQAARSRKSGKLLRLPSQSVEG